MFKRTPPTPPNLLEVRTQLIQYVISFLSQYRQQLKENPQLKTEMFTPTLEKIDPNKFMPQAQKIFTRDVLKEIEKDRTGAAIELFLSEQTFFSIPHEFMDFYLIILDGLGTVYKDMDFRRA